MAATETGIRRPPTLTEAESALLTRVNDTAAEFDDQACIHTLFDRTVRRTPDAVAVVMGDVSLTYAELNDRAGRLAATMRRLGVGDGNGDGQGDGDGNGDGDIVAVLAERSPEMLIAVLAVLKSGAAYLPIDPAYPRARNEYLLTDSRARLVLAQNRHLAAVSGAARLLDLNAETSYAAEPVAGGGRADQLAYVIYTSGSTGRPKGVMIEHRSVINRLTWMQKAFPIAAGDVILQKTPISFDVSVWELFWWMFQGATVCLLEPGGEKNPDVIVSTVERHGVTVMHFVPSMLTVFLDYVESTGQVARLRSLRRVFVSGEALATGQVRRFHDLFDGSGTSLVNLYGPTEATVDVSYFDCARAENRSRIPIGRPIDNTRLYVVDEESRINPPGVPGELCIAGVGLARGYLDRPELTAEKFVTDPFDGEERIYRTGDLAQLLPTGEFDYLGRIDHQVKIRGFRVELGEIEHWLHDIDAVRDAVVVAYGEGETVELVGYVLLREPMAEQALRDELARMLPAHMVPARVVELDAFPLLPNGKTDRAALPRPTAAADTGHTGTGHAEPRTETERVICDIWESVLGVAGIGVDDNFYTLGGNSIHFISVLAKINAAGLSCSFQQMFQHPTIAQLAEVVTGAGGTTGATGATDAADTATAGAATEAGAPTRRTRPFELLSEEDRAKVPEDAEDAYPLSMLQAGLIFQSELQHGSAQYHDIFSYIVQASFDAATFEAAVRELVRDNPIFRTGYHLTGFSEAVQVVHRDVPLPLQIVDLRGQREQTQDRWYAEWLRLEKAHRFRWTEPGLIRLHVHVLSDDHYRYSVSFHDSAVDGWSITLIHTKIFQTYYRLLAGTQVPAPEVHNHQRDYIALERAALRSEESARFWRDVLTADSAARLPRWDPPSDGDHEVVITSVPLPADLSDRIRALAGSLAVPVKNVLLAAHVRVLAALTGKSAVLTGYEHSGRPEQEGADAAIGLFLNSVPFGIDVAGGTGTWADLVRRVRDTEAELLPHRRYPMARMKQDVRAPAGPLFESVFNFTHFYPLKELRELPEFSLLNVQVLAETEFPLRAEFSQHPTTDQVRLSLHYHAAVFGAEYIERIGGYYLRALELMTTDPEQEHRASLLSEAEVRHQVWDLNGASRPLPDRRFHELFEDQVRARPDAVAVLCGGERWTYAALNRRANQVAHRLLADGLAAEDVVAVVSERDPRWAAAVLGVLKAGGVYLPIDPRYPDERVATLLRQSGCRYVIAQGTVQDIAQGTVQDIAQGTVQDTVQDTAEDGVARLRALSTAGTRVIDVTEVTEAPAATADGHDPAVPVSAGQAAYIYFTSGSTGVPKGALCEHGGMLNHLLAKIADMRIGEGDTVVQNASQCFDISLWQLLAALMVGGRTLIVPQDAVVDVARFVDTIVSGRATVVQVVPSYLDIMLAHLARHPDPLADLRRVSVTGEAVRRNLVDRWFAAYPHVPLVNAYGATETSDDVTHEVMVEPPATELVPVGRPIPNMSVYVVDQVLDDHLTLAPLGSRGEIVFSGVGIARGYVNDEERTGRWFGADPFGPGRRMYRSGDFGRWLPDGRLEFLGRIDEQVKVRGMRLELGEIEAALLAHDAVREAAVVARPDAGQVPAVVGYVTADHQLDPATLRPFLRARLPEFMVPSVVRQVEALPLTQNGKIDKKALQAVAVDPENTGDAYVAPATETERTIAETWSAVLGLPANTVGRTDDFFHLGGHSLAAMRVVSLLNGLVSLTDLMTHPVLQRLAAAAASAEPADRRLLRPLTAATDETRCVLVCVPYAAGNAINFRPVALELRSEVSSRLAVYAVEPPGHDPAYRQEPLRSVDELAHRVVDEVVAAHPDVPVAVWGHCAGAALGLEVARRLEGRGVDVRQVFVGGRLLRDVDRMLDGIAEVREMTDADARQWLVDRTGFADLDALAPDDVTVVGRAFRHDTETCNQYLVDAATTLRRPPLRAPLDVVVCTDDPLTTSYPDDWRRWRTFADEVRLTEIPAGGHYFLRTRAPEVARTIVDALHVPLRASTAATAGVSTEPAVEPAVEPTGRWA